MSLRFWSWLSVLCSLFFIWGSANSVSSSVWLLLWSSSSPLLLSWIGGVVMSHDSSVKNKSLMGLMNLQSSQDKHTLHRFHLRFYYLKVDSISSCRFQIHLCIPACVMSSEFTWNFCQLRFLEFDVNVFKTILSIQRIFNLTKYWEVVTKIHCKNSLPMQECRFEFYTSCSRRNL